MSRFGWIRWTKAGAEPDRGCSMIIRVTWGPARMRNPKNRCPRWRKLVGAGLLFSVILCIPFAIRVGAAEFGGQMQWKKTVEAAEKEGKLVVLTVRGFSPYLYRV